MRVAYVLHLEHDAPRPRSLPAEVEPDEALFGPSIFSILSRSFCLLLAWVALLALALFFSTKRSSCALRSALAFALRASCSSRALFSVAYLL